LEPGVPTDVTVLVRPMPAQVTSFGAGALRVRSVVAEVVRVPPGAAPLVRVEVAGVPDDVAIEVAAARLPLVRDGDVWVGRVPVSASAAAGVWPFVVVARSGDQATERRDQLIVDPDAPLLEPAADGPVRAGTSLGLSAVVYLEAVSVEVDGPYGAVSLSEAVPGRWVGELMVPANAPAEVVELVATVFTVDGVVATAPFRFRVLAP
jgi:hypothetical protein